VRVRNGRATVTGHRVSPGVRNSAAAAIFSSGTLDPGEVCKLRSRDSEPAPPAVKRLLLVRHAPTAATRAATFAGDEPLDGAGLAGAAQLSFRLPRGCTVVSSPAMRCTQTAEQAGFAPAVDARLAECDFGEWAGRSLQEVWDADPAGASRWLSDPDSAPHRGESLSRFRGRVAEWLDEQAPGDGRTVAFTHAGVIRASVVHALDAPLASFWNIDAAPLSITELHAQDGRWRVVRVNA
jgi:broad specificity phosphatase PhoE